MHEQEFAIVRSLIPVAWADGAFAATEKEMLEALLEAYGASPEQRSELEAYAKEKRTIEDIDLQELSAADRRVLLQNAVLMSFADGEQHPSESAFLTELATYLRVPADEAKAVMAEAEARAKNLAVLLK